MAAGAIAALPTRAASALAAPQTAIYIWRKLGQTFILGLFEETARELNVSNHNSLLEP